MPTSEEVTPERAPPKKHGPYSVILLVLPVMFAGMFIAIGILGLLAKLFSW